MPKKITTKTLSCISVQHNVRSGTVVFVDKMPTQPQPGKAPEQPTVRVAMQFTDPKGSPDFVPGKQYTFAITED